MHIRNPVEWTVDQLRVAGHAVETAGHARPLEAAPAVRKIGFAEVRDALERGLDDFAAFRTDVVFLCIVYPSLGSFWRGSPLATTSCRSSSRSYPGLR